jgi:hypothetical protein
VLIAGLFSITGVAEPDIQPAQPAPRADPRLARIQQYFRDRLCPADQYAEDFLKAADEHDLDWRLLPSLSMIETAGGKGTRNNNMFGWANAQVRFRNSREGIYRVASRLKTSKLYKNKDLDGILRTYNPHPSYRNRVKYVMRQLGPAELAPTQGY